ncbi:unnamed protein product [Kluyveromyces dobzhanskii CBS 2104]|uniref:WGS project CCBQ000000000 data, contig MAT n=1 Tax=Kluyveromyces dobzhanskii CBS 2104 TaxID=1427455 RepID=A0A0A8L3N0_9SACH|nr:unnamed protein product [Kluyveromyces dobzhanskii CBS 2104]
MAAIEDQLKDLLDDTSVLSQHIEADPQYKGSDLIDSKPAARLLEEVLREDSNLTKDLAKYNRYKVLSDLIKEFNTNFELDELENCYYSLQNLCKKFQEVDISDESFRFQQSVATYIDCLHVNLLLKLKDVSNKFCVVSGNELVFKKAIKVESVEFKFDEIMELCENNLFDHQTIDQTHWFITSTNLETYKDTEIPILHEILADFIKLNPLIVFFRNFAFGDNSVLSREGPGKLRISTTKISALKQVESYEILTSFMDNDLSISAKRSAISQFGNTLLTELLKIIRKNPELLSNDKEKTTQLITSIHGSLSRISKDTKWPYDDCELNKILKDENIYTTLKFETMMQQRIAQIRSIPKEEYGKLISVQIKSNLASVGKNGTHGNDISAKTPNSGKDSEDWEWNEDQESDDNDGWAEELDLDVDDLPIEVSAFTQSAKNVFNEFENGCDNIGRSKLESIYSYKLNLLQTTFFAMITGEASDWTQLYKDVRYIYTENAKLGQLMELNSRYLDLNVDLMKKKISKLVNDQLQELKENERNPQWDVTISSLLPYLKGGALPTLYKLEDNSVLVSLVSFIIHDLVFANILRWRVISEKGSENLSEFVTLLLPALEIPRLNLIDEYRYSREKLGILGKILTAHLKDILELFYEGEFFLFETDEIIQWIILLFAETPTRRDCIDEIRRVREDATD